MKKTIEDLEKRGNFVKQEARAHNKGLSAMLAAE